MFALIETALVSRVRRSKVSVKRSNQSVSISVIFLLCKKLFIKSLCHAESVDPIARNYAKRMKSQFDGQRASQKFDVLSI